MGFGPGAQEAGMNVGSIAGDMALSAVNGQVNVSVMKATQNLQEDLVARLFGSIGLGNSVNATA